MTTQDQLIVPSISADPVKIKSSDCDPIWLKITNEKECHHGFQYEDGLNVLEQIFNDDPDISCCWGGFYFTNAKHIFKYVEYGCHVREITLPTSDPEFKMVKDPSGDKWRANKIIFGKKYDLWSIDTFKMLIGKGADVHICNEFPMRIASKMGHLEIVKFLVEETGSDVHAYYDQAINYASKYNHPEIVNFLMKNFEKYGYLLWDEASHTNISINSANDTSKLNWAYYNGYTEVIKYFITNGADIDIFEKIVMDRTIEFRNTGGRNAYACEILHLLRELKEAQKIEKIRD